MIGHPCGCPKFIFREKQASMWMQKGEDAYVTGIGVCMLPGTGEQGEGAEILPEDLRVGICSHLSPVWFRPVFG